MGGNVDCLGRIQLSTSLEPNLLTVGSAATWNLQNLPTGNLVLRSPTSGSARASHRSTWLWWQ